VPSHSCANDIRDNFEKKIGNSDAIEEGFRA
jgi:hypothetical protein